MTEVAYEPRSTWRTSPPDSNAGTPRPLLKLPVPTMTAHYTGSPWIGRFRTQTAQQFMPAFEAQADRVQKSFEYNYVIPPGRPTPEVWEYAGVYQAAHSAGENHLAIGVLFGNGVNNHPSYPTYDPAKPTEWEPLDDNQVIAFRWLRDVHLAGLGAVSVKTTLTPHRSMPGANTPCPGNAVLSRWAELAQPYAPPAPPPPPPTEVPDVFTYTPAGYANAFLIGAGPATHLDGPSFALVKDTLKVPHIAAKDPHPQMLRCILHQSGLTESDLVKLP